MDVSTIDFFKAVKKIADGDEATAQTITEYIDGGKVAKIAELKEVFLTKDDKIDLVTRMDGQFRIVMGTLVTLLIAVLSLGLYIASHLPK